jgi:UDP-N-acetylglucosamine acyltransferase
MLKNVVIEPLQLFITMLSLVMELDWFKCNHNGRRKNRKNCNIFPGAVISAVPQDLKFGGEDSLAIIGDNWQYVSA